MKAQADELNVPKGVVHALGIKEFNKKKQPHREELFVDKEHVKGQSFQIGMQQVATWPQMLCCIWKLLL